MKILRCAKGDLAASDEAARRASTHVEASKGKMTACNLDSNACLEILRGIGDWHGYLGNGEMTGHLLHCNSEVLVYLYCYAR